jgi:hypothetical protein
VEALLERVSELREEKKKKKKGRREEKREKSEAFHVFCCASINDACVLCSVYMLVCFYAFMHVWMYGVQGWSGSWLMT